MSICILYNESKGLRLAMVMVRSMIPIRLTGGAGCVGEQIGGGYTIQCQLISAFTFWRGLAD